MKKSLIFMAVCAIIALGSYIKAEQGDYATLGYNTPSGYSFWRVNSSGYFIPGAASTLDIGTSVLPVKTIYVGTVTGATIAGGASLTVTGAVSGATLAGTTSVTSPLYIATGAIRNYSRTKAQINALTSVAIGDEYYCSDCTAVTKCVSTGTFKGSFVTIDARTVVCD